MFLNDVMVVQKCSNFLYKTFPDEVRKLLVSYDVDAFLLRLKSRAGSLQISIKTMY